MKKFIIIVCVLILYPTISYSAEETSSLDEIKLDVNSIYTPNRFKSRMDDEEDAEFEAKERKHIEMQQEGEDYMYRRKQQLMAPVNINPMNGLMPFGNISY